jgi:acetone carboxylase gamma subunit
VIPGDIRCFLLTPARKLKRTFRRYASGSTCQFNHGYHNAHAPLDVIPYHEPIIRAQNEAAFAGDDRWPTHCQCGYEFSASDTWQIFTDSIYVRQDTGEELALSDAPPGAMWDAEWLHGHPMWEGPDGKSLMVICPCGTHWHIDGVANNCTMKHDHVHKCWVREGEPPNLTVGKNGYTCAAGAGSIQTPTWHGFLTRGILSVNRNP